MEVSEDPAFMAFRVVSKDNNFSVDVAAVRRRDTNFLLAGANATWRRQGCRQSHPSFHLCHRELCVERVLDDVLEAHEQPVRQQVVLVHHAHARAGRAQPVLAALGVAVLRAVHPRADDDRVAQRLEVGHVSGR
ncbi:hypothetical protein PF001_g32930 [Phytophthora fragariae]|uniref:Uncharacterized protein n=2 Tax=Phytophthora fragariae TaxID=53985 RepID=A0A6A4AKA4_9STRA|nr:hypothetical protein PF009_g32737 [Phytophthora fragariae]KAE9259783.1 hypothetical protein PF001_g32930 [Phytophthora fragariae]